jgi:hypothetical protein
MKFWSVIWRERTTGTAAPQLTERKHKYMVVFSSVATHGVEDAAVHNKRRGRAAARISSCIGTCVRTGRPFCATSHTSTRRHRRRHRRCPDAIDRSLRESSNRQDDYHDVEKQENKHGWKSRRSNKRGEKPGRPLGCFAPGVVGPSFGLTLSFPDASCSHAVKEPSCWLLLVPRPPAATHRAFLVLPGQEWVPKQQK